MEISGISASSGIAIGPVHIFRQNTRTPELRTIQPGDVEREIERLELGKTLSVSQLEKIYSDTLEKVGEEEAGLFEGQIEIVTDEDLTCEITGIIKNRLIDAESAVSLAFQDAISEVESLDDEYLRARADDLRDISRRIINNISGVETVDALSGAAEPVIVVAHDITPSDFARMDTAKIAGICSETGSLTSHVAIMARALAIPAVVGACNAVDAASGKGIAILDGGTGTVIVNPASDTLAMYRAKLESDELEKQRLAEIVKLPSITSDGRHIELSANIGTDRDIEAAIRFGAQGIGLFRTEYLFLDRQSMPPEQAQFTAYKKVLESMPGRNVTFRTVDLGGDKAIPYIDFPEEQNPFLGWRGVRLYKDCPAIIRTQLRAILRAGLYGHARIMFPMIVSVEELRQLKALVSEIETELKSAGIAFAENIAVGVMIETPAAAMISDMLAGEADFFSIGTNDLTQYTLAVDRGNNRIASQYDELHPSVLRLIKLVIDNAHACGKPVGMCGELAANLQATKLLIGLGLDELSMSAPRIPSVKEAVINGRYEDTVSLARQIRGAGSSVQVRKILSGE